MKCQARQHSDQMICHKCGLVWDMNDPDPPVCEDVTLVKPRNTKILDGCVIRIGEVEYTPVGYRELTLRKLYPEAAPCDFVFRSKLCGYTGDEQNCDKSFSGCHNKERFNGTPWSTK